MHLASLLVDDHPALAVQTDSGFALLSPSPQFPFGSLKAVLQAGPEALQLASDRAADAPVIDAQRCSFLPVISEPSKVICVGRNYAEHAREQGAEVPGEPLIFAKAPSAIHAHRCPIGLPTLSHQVDYEAELVVVIGKRARCVSRQEAWDHVAGYCCGNDITARDWQKQKPGQQWLLGKSFDTFAPIGPWLVTADSIPDPSALSIQMWLNGERVQDACTSQMMFPIDFLISYVSQVMTLEVGDLIFTGTPSGVGVAQDPPRFLQAGDQLAVEISQIGRLENDVRSER